MSSLPTAAALAAASPAATAEAAADMQRAPLHEAVAEIFKLVSAGATAEQWAEWLRAPLEHTAATGNHDLFKRLVDAGANCGAGWQGCGGRTLLDAAALGGEVNIVSTLLQKGCRADVNVLATSSGRSALHTAIVSGHAAAARKLVLAGADVHYEDPADERPPLVAAVRGGCGAMVTDLLLAGASSNGWREHYEHVLLHVAAASGHAEVVTALLGAGFDIDHFGRRSMTPLMLASEEGHLPTVEVLLAAGADVNLRTSEGGDSALDFAALDGNTDVMKAILGHGVHADVRCPLGGCTALHRAACANEVGAVELLLDAGADVNAVDNDAQTPLHVAAHFGSSDTSRVLLQRGASVDAAGRDGKRTALYLACLFKRSGYQGVVEHLLRWGPSEVAVNPESSEAVKVIDMCLGDIRTSTDEEEMRRASELERLRLLIMRSPADRAWRRRCLLVILRSRNDNERVFPVPSHCCGKPGQHEQEAKGERSLAGAKGTADAETGEAGENGAKAGEDEAAENAGVAAAAAEEACRGGLAGMVVEQMPDAVFQKIVLFL